MYTNFTKMIKYFFPPSVCLEEIKMLQIYVKFALRTPRQAASLFFTVLTPIQES